MGGQRRAGPIGGVCQMLSIMHVGSTLGQQMFRPRRAERIYILNKNLVKAVFWHIVAGVVQTSNNMYCPYAF